MSPGQTERRRQREDTPEACGDQVTRAEPDQRTRAHTVGHPQLGGSVLPDECGNGIAAPQQRRRVGSRPGPQFRGTAVDRAAERRDRVAELY